MLIYLSKPRNVGSCQFSSAQFIRNMDSTFPLKKMKRSKSLNCIVDSESRMGGEWENRGIGDDSGVQSTDGSVSLERKVDRLNDICMEQTRVLVELTQHVRDAERTGDAGRTGDAALAAALGELIQLMAEEREKTGVSGARSLLSAIELKPSLERRVGDALTDLLQSEDLKQRIISSTTASIKELIQELFSVEESSLYVPMERAHRQLLGHVTEMVAAAFADLEENTACNEEALWQTSRSLQAALLRHQALLEEACDSTGRLLDTVASTTEKVIERELKQWREKMSEAWPPAASEGDSGRAESPGPMSECASLDDAPSPDTNNGTHGLSPVDRLMITAEVNKLIRDGDMNEAFKKALLAMELSVVTAACRAAAPAFAQTADSPAVSPAQRVGVDPPAVSPVFLTQPVLLSLLQQLATDLLLDTQLKCSYIEYALLNVNPLEAATRAHLPLVAGELCRHLSGFLRKYPHHAHSRRIAAIMDTARSFL